MKKTLLSCISLGVALAAYAAPPTLQPHDFATGRRVDTQGDAPFYRVELPLEVYTGTAYADLRDVRVFNAAGEALPHSLVTPYSQVPRPARIALRSFRNIGEPKANGIPDIEVERDTDARLRVQVRQQGSGPGRSEYLLVVPEGTRAGIQSLHLRWEPRPEAWQQRITVDASDDLHLWQTLATDRPIMELRNGTENLVQDTIPLEAAGGQTWKYWRLRFAPGEAPVLSAVEASPVLPRAAVAAASLTATTTATEADGSVVYDLPSAQPLSALRVLPAQRNSVLPLSIDYRTAPDQKWQNLASTVAYRVVSPLGEQRSPAIELPARPLVRQLRLRSLGTGWGAEPPQVFAEREARMLVFNARGSGPYLVAWGSRAADEASLPLKTLVPDARDHSVDTFPAAIPTEPVTLGGKERLTALAPAERSELWHKALVWIALVMGALLLALLAWRVWKEMQSGQTG